MRDRIRLLIVEDNEADSDLIADTLLPHGLGADPIVVRDGAAACAFVNREPPYEDADRPHLILLDVNLPRLDGHGVLRAIRANHELAKVPVVMLTSSEAERDIEAAYRGGANSYVTKPVGLLAFQTAIREIERFWGQVASLP